MSALDINTLIAAAAEAPAKAGASNRGSYRWATLWPVASRLRAKGYSWDDVIDWLVEQGAVGDDDRDRAKNAFWQLACRRRRKNQTNNDNNHVPRTSND